MKRRELIKCLSVLPLSALNVGLDASFASNPTYGKIKLANTGEPKRIAAIVTEYRLNSHTDVIVGKYLEGFNQDQMPPYPESKIVSIFTEQVPENDLNRDMAKKYNIPVFQIVMDALKLGGDELAVDGVLLIGEHGNYPNDNMNCVFGKGVALFQGGDGILNRTMPFWITKMTKKSDNVIDNVIAFLLSRFS
ncbi:hypothetical protein [Daejeonella sp.]|uniref:hypothetical protein n=1 Tax=Daejeonella sp. TaxID=2805397 RepID=UPI0030C316AE